MNRPNLGPDMTYSQQRKVRMQDAIDDYLQDPKVDARQCYEDILTCVEDVLKYHRTELDKATDLYNFLLGNRKYEFNVEPPSSVGTMTTNEDGSSSYEYAAKVTMSDIYKFQRGNSL